jgi:hypothetical protein
MHNGEAARLGDRPGDGQGTYPRDHPGDAQGDGPGEWLSVAEAARRLGVVPKAVRSRIARGTLRWRSKGNHGREVFILDAEPEGDGPGDGPDLVALQVQAARLEEQLAATRAVAAVELTARTAVIEALEAGLAAERTRADRLEIALAEARKGWLERLIEAVRKR